MIRKTVKACVLLAAAFVASQSAQAQITSAMQVPDGANRVDQTKPGMKMRIFKGNNRLTIPNINFAEAYISGMPFNPDSRAGMLDLVNGAVTNWEVDPPQPESYADTFWWIIPYVNVHDNAGSNPSAAGGNFTPTATAPHTKAELPQWGIPGTGENYYVVEYTGYLQLPAGTVRFGVNSDDGFRLTIGNGADVNAVPGTTPAGVQLTNFDTTRGFGNTEVTVNNIAAGFYPFRLIWFENEGGTAGCEFFTFAPGQTGGSRYLVGDTTQANAIRVFWKLNDAPPQITGRYPIANSGSVEARPAIRAVIENGDVPVDRASITVTVDGNLVQDVQVIDDPNAAMTSQPLNSHRIITPPQGPFLPGTSHTVVVAGANTAGAPFTYSWSFTVANYLSVPASFSVGSVDTTKPGFRAKIEQTEIVQTSPQTSQSWAAERRIARGYNDPATGQPYPNLANLTGADAQGYFIDEDVINWNQSSPAGTGSFQTGEEIIPGIDPGVVDPLTARHERFVYSIETILELPAGVYRLGANTDDGFRLTAGRGPGEVTGLEVMAANVDRGPTDSTADINIPADGFYPFRLMWWETGGGAAAEFFFVKPDGTKILLNDPANAEAIKAYRESANTPPHVTRVLPVVNEPYAFADQDLIIELTEQSIPVIADSIVLQINGVAQNITKTKEGNVTRIVRDSTVDYLLPSGANNVILTYAYGATSADVTWSFNVPAYTRVIPAGNRVPLEHVSGSGFTLHQVNHIHRGGTSQGDAGRYAAPGGGGNNWPGPEIQLARGYLDLAGNPFPNNSRAPYDAGPSLDNAFGLINFNTTSGVGTGNTGYLNGDGRIPFDQSTGNVGTGTGTDNFVQEYITYIDLKRGAHIFGVNPDDGFSMHSSPNPRDTLGTLVGWKPAPGGQAGFPLANNNVAFNVIVPEDGIYPFRLLYWEGGGDARVEFMALDRDTGRLAAVNNSDFGLHVPSQPGSPLPPYTPYIAYSGYTGPVRPWTRFSVYPSRNETSFFNNSIQQTGPGPITIRLNNQGNPGDLANYTPSVRPFGDAIGAIIADAGNSTIGLKVNGETVQPTITTLPNGDKKVLYTPATPLAPGVQHTAALIYAGVENVWSFTTIVHEVVPADVRRPSTDAIQDKRGFLMKVAQSAAARPGGNTAAAAELQLTGTPANVAIANPDRPDGAYVVPGAINMNVNKNNPTPGGDNGNFTAARTSQADEPFPGLNGTLAGATARENFTVEAIAWLELPAGYQKFAVNGDDGFIANISDASGQVLFTIDRGGGSADLPFAFWVPQAGLYPIRVVMYQGNGGGNFEFFSYGENGSKILVNDPNNPAAIKAYYEVTGGVLPEPEITTTFQNGILTINWNNGGELQSSPAVTGQPWSGTGAIGNPNGTYQVTIPAGGGTTFYRVRRAQ